LASGPWSQMSRPVSLVLCVFMCPGCNCNPAGSVDLQCDVTTGACTCRTNIDGQNCDKCEENKYNIEAGCLGGTLFSTYYMCMIRTPVLTDCEPLSIERRIFLRNLLYLTLILNV